MRTQKLFILLFILFQLFACNFHVKKELPANMEEAVLAPLDSSIVYYQDQWPLDTLFYLTGEKKALDDTLIHDVNDFLLKDNQFLKYTEDTILYDRKNRILFSPQAVNNDSIYFRDSMIIRTTHIADSVLEKPVYQLKMHPSDGMLAVNISKNRMVFVYKYYHIIQVMDLDVKTVKTIDFKNGNHYYDHEYDKRFYMDAPNPHIEYYCDVFAGKDYFYVLYVGHSYKEYYNSINRNYKWSNVKHKPIKTDTYQQDIPNIVEQYDWNGNPVGRYLLEGETVFRNGRFAVDETNRRFYLLVSENCETFMLATGCYDHFLMTYPFPANLQK